MRYFYENIIRLLERIDEYRNTLYSKIDEFRYS